MKKLLLASIFTGLCATAIADDSYMRDNQRSGILKDDIVTQCNLLLTGTTTGPSEKNALDDCVRTHTASTNHTPYGNNVNVHPQHRDGMNQRGNGHLPDNSDSNYPRR